MPLERILFSQELVQITKPLVRAKKHILITSRNVLILKKSTLFGLVGRTKFSIESRFSIISLEFVLFSKITKELVFSFGVEGDLHIETPSRDDLMIYTFLAVHISGRIQKSLTLYFEGEISLANYCRYIGSSSNRKVKEVAKFLEPLKVTREEFYIHYLGMDSSLVKSSIPPVHIKHKMKEFEFIRLVGIGELSHVYLAKKIDTKELFAVKVISYSQSSMYPTFDEFKKLLINERKILMKIDHPFIIKLKYTFQQKGCYYFVMSYVAGGELLSQIKDKQFQNREKM